MTAGMTARELWWMSHVFSFVDINGCPCSYINRGINNRQVGDRSSETQSHPIDMNIIFFFELLQQGEFASLETFPSKHFDFHVSVKFDV
jgi:hypothetical protein